MTRPFCNEAGAGSDRLASLTRPALSETILNHGSKGPLVIADSPRTIERKREILRAASGLFRRKGLHAAGMRDIAAELGMAVGNLYITSRARRPCGVARRRPSTGAGAGGAGARRRARGLAAVRCSPCPSRLNEETPGRSRIWRSRSWAALSRPILRGGEPTRRRCAPLGRRHRERCLQAMDSTCRLARYRRGPMTVKWFRPDGRGRPRRSRRVASCWCAAARRRVARAVVDAAPAAGAGGPRLSEENHGTPTTTTLPSLSTAKIASPPSPLTHLLEVIREEPA